MVVASRAASLGPLTAWLLSNGAKMNGCEIAWLGGSMGAGLIATEDLPAGAAACSVPRRLLLSSSSGLSDSQIGPRCWRRAATADDAHGLLADPLSAGSLLTQLAVLTAIAYSCLGALAFSRGRCQSVRRLSGSDLAAATLCRRSGARRLLLLSTIASSSHLLLSPPPLASSSHLLLSHRSRAGGRHARQPQGPRTPPLLTPHRRASRVARR